MKLYTKFVVVYCLTLLNWAIVSSCSAQESDSIDLSDDKTTILDFPDELKPAFRNPISENKHCYLSLHEDDLFIASIQDWHENAKYHNKLHIRRVDSAGDSVWLYTFDQHAHISFKDIYAVEDGVYILYEGYTGNGDIERNCYLTKLSPDGVPLWEVDFGKKYGTDGLDMMKLDAEGNLIVSNKHYERCFIYRINPKGEVLKTASFTEKSELIIMDFAFDEAGHIYAIGQITSYPEKVYTTELFAYKLNKDFEILEQAVWSMGTLSIAHSIKYIGQGNFAVHFSTDVDMNRPSSDQMYSYFSLMDSEMKLSNPSQFRTGESGRNQRFVQMSEDRIISYNRKHYNENSYFVFSEFDAKMNYVKSTLVNFNTGVYDMLFTPNHDLWVARFREELWYFEKPF